MKLERAMLENLFEQEIEYLILHSYIYDPKSPVQVYDTRHTLDYKGKSREYSLDLELGDISVIIESIWRDSPGDHVNLNTTVYGFQDGGNIETVPFHRGSFISESQLRELADVASWSDMESEMVGSTSRYKKLYKKLSRLPDGLMKVTLLSKHLGYLKTLLGPEIVKEII